MAILYVATKGLLDDVPTPRVKDFEQQFIPLPRNRARRAAQEARQNQGSRRRHRRRPRGGRQRIPQDLPGVAEQAAWPASATSEGASVRRRTSGRSRGRCSSWQRPSFSAPRTRRSRRGRTRDKLDEVLADVAAVLSGEEHPLLSRREEGKRLIVLVTSDRGSGRAAQHQRDPVRARKEIVDHPGDLRSWQRRPQGPRCACAGRGVPIVAHLPGLRRPPVVRRHPAAGPPHHRRLRGRHVRPGRPRLHAVRLHAGPARRHSSQLLPIEPSADTRGIPGTPVHLRAQPRRRPRASCCRDTSRYASLPGGAGEHGAASIRARWWR